MRTRLSKLAWLMLTICIGQAFVAHGQDATAPSDAEPIMYTLRVVALVPEGTPPVYLAGSLPQLGPWRPAHFRMSGDGHRRQADVPVASGTKVEFKLTLGSWATQALDAQGNVPPNSAVEVTGDTTVVVEVPSFAAAGVPPDPAGAGVLGRLTYWTDVPSQFLPRPRHVAVWLPPQYETDPERRFPVLYMHDGQNLFDPRTCMTRVDWGMDEAIVRLSQEGKIPPIIIVAPFSTDDRYEDYSPWHLGPAYARFLIEELKPRVDTEFRTLVGPEATGTMGSSMGGLISLYLGWKHPEVFSRIGAVAAHLVATSAGRVPMPGSESLMAMMRREGGTLKGLRIYMDRGTADVDALYPPFQADMVTVFQEHGLLEGIDYTSLEFESGHNEAAWRARVDTPLTFLFGDLVDEAK